ncbi:MAG: hypothetical protein AAF456_05780 [Planctomycetota bacterium]
MYNIARYNIATQFAAIVLIFNSVLLVPVHAQDAVPAQPEEQWWKGNLHTHSLWSDGDDFPEMIAEWYRTHDYNFLALSDHNVLSEGQRWMSATAIAERGGDTVLEKYQARFGGGWVETREVIPTSVNARIEQIQAARNGNLEPALEVRLKPLDEFRHLVESRGRFIMIPSEEISDRAEGKPVHMNATNLKEAIAPVGGETVRQAMENNLRAVEEQADKLGREIMLHLNHPNFGWAVSAEDLAAVTSEQFYEVYNGHPGVNHLGDDENPTVEEIWDIANAIRLTALSSPPLLGIATDDSHKYHGVPGSHPGRGWVMVKSRYLTPEHLIRAMRNGDFYSSSGVSLSDVTFDGDSRSLSVTIAPSEGETYAIEFVVTRSSGTDEVPPADQTGIVVQSSTGNTASYTMSSDDLYVRARITSSAEADDPAYDGQNKQAWTQPVGWE